MAMPTSAWASAGASFTPSPTIATTLALRLQPLHVPRLVGGQHLGEDARDAELARHRLGGARVVAR